MKTRIDCVALATSLILAAQGAQAADAGAKRINTKNATQAPAKTAPSAKPFKLATCRLAGGDVLTAACPVDAKVSCVRGEQAIRCDGRKAESTSRTTAAEARPTAASAR